MQVSRGKQSNQLMFRYYYYHYYYCRDAKEAEDPESLKLMDDVLGIRIYFDICFN